MTRNHLLFLLSGLVLLSAPTMAEVSTLTGTFVGVSMGDYAHLQVRDAKGQERSFFVLTGDKSFEPFLESPQNYRGRRIRLKWRRVERNIPEAGGPMEIDEAISIQLIR